MAGDSVANDDREDVWSSNLRTRNCDLDELGRRLRSPAGESCKSRFFPKSFPLQRNLREI